MLAEATEGTVLAWGAIFAGVLYAAVLIWLQRNAF